MRVPSLFILSCLFVTLAVFPMAASALCNVTYTAQDGDNLSGVAELHYADSARWSWLAAANPDLSASPDSALAQGSQVFIPCTPPDPSGQMVASPDMPKVNVLTIADFAPFSSRTWPAQGIMAELITAALGAGPAPLRPVTAWAENAADGVSQLADSRGAEIGFPLPRPDCSADEARDACARLLYSDPVIEVPLVLFVRSGGGVTYQDDSDLAGRHLCRPAAYSMASLDTPDRHWISEKVVNLVTPDRPETCFQMLAGGQVDAVMLNALTGATTIAAMNLSEQVTALDKPLAQHTLHVAVPKVHWRATTLIYRINAGLRALRETGEYDRVVGRHMTLLWDRLN